jgi:hypothetical protein
MTFHRNHHIESPVSHTELNIEKPNACVACHLDQTDQWLFEHSARLWNQPVPEQAHGHIQSLVELHAGDPVQRAVAAYQMAHQLDSLPASERLFLIPHLLIALEDPYPAIRRFAYKALLAIINGQAERQSGLIQLARVLEPFDFIADEAQRKQVTGLTRQWLLNTDFSGWPQPPAGAMLLPGYQPDWQALEPLRREAMRSDKVIHVGE